MYESIQRNSSNEKFRARYTSGDTDIQNHAGLRFFDKNGKRLNQLKILKSTLLKTYSIEIKPHNKHNQRKPKKK